MDDIPSQMRKLRDDAGLTQSEAAKLLFTDTQSISRWERGERQIRAETFERAKELYARHIAQRPARLGRDASGALVSDEDKRFWFIVEIVKAGADDDDIRLARLSLAGEGGSDLDQRILHLRGLFAAKWTPGPHVMAEAEGKAYPSVKEWGAVLDKPAIAVGVIPHQKKASRSLSLSDADAGAIDRAKEKAARVSRPRRKKPPRGA